MTIHRNTTVSVISSVISLGLIFYQYKFTPTYFDFRIAAGAVALLAWFAASSEIQKHSSNFQFYAMFLSSLLLGLSIDKFLHGFPFITTAVLLATFTGLWRFMLRQWISETSFFGIDFLYIAISLSLYAAGNLIYAYGWNGWAFPLPLMGMVIFLARKDFMFGKATMNYFKKGYAVEVGKPAPDFSLPDESGSITKLSDFKSKNDLLLIFIRNVWCPSCHIMLRTYEKNNERFQKKNITLLAIGPDPEGANRNLAAKLGINFKVLSDEGQKTAMTYGVHLPVEIVGQEFDPGMPLPASFLVDKNGIVRYTSRPDQVGEFLDPATIFPALESLN